jgi:serine phosphatase RsbU (regulator of sigma subunit)
MRLAGHPPPVLFGAAPEVWRPALANPPLGVLPGTTWTEDAISLPVDWALLLYTDGLIEGLPGDAAAGPGERLGLERLVEHFAVRGDDGKRPPSLDHLLEWAEAKHGGPLPDDVALFLVGVAR